MPLGHIRQRKVIWTT